MTDRDRLTNELKKAKNNCLIRESGGCLACKYSGQADCTLENLVDCLLENGVIVPPIKVGTKVYVITSQTSNGKNLYIFEDIITHYVVCDNYTLMCFENHIAEANHNWDKIFLTKEEAEAKMKELGK